MKNAQHGDAFLVRKKIDYVRGMPGQGSPDVAVDRGIRRWTFSEFVENVANRILESLRCLRRTLLIPLVSRRDIFESRGRGVEVDASSPEDVALDLIPGLFRIGPSLAVRDCIIDGVEVGSRNWYIAGCQTIP